MHAIASNRFDFAVICSQRRIRWLVVNFSQGAYVLDRKLGFGKLLWHAWHRGMMAQSPRLLIAEPVWTLYIKSLKVIAEAECYVAWP